MPIVGRRRRCADNPLIPPVQIPAPTSDNSLTHHFAWNKRCLAPSTAVWPDVSPLPEEDKLEVGLFHMPLHPADKPLGDVLAENTEKIIYADQLGFSETWIGEHYTATTEPITAPMMFLASLLPQTKQIRLGTGVICLPNHHPAQIAGQAAQFDHMAKGRFMMGIGPGGLISDMELFDVLDAGVRMEKFAESIGMIKQIWAQDPPYDIKGKHWHICQRQSKSEPNGSAKCCHFGVGEIAGLACASIRATALVTELAVARMLWPVRAIWVGFGWAVMPCLGGPCSGPGDSFRRSSQGC